MAAQQLDSTKNSSRQKEEGGDEVEGSAYNDAYQTEGQQQKPDEWIEHHGGDGNGPAGNEQQTEEEQLEHG